MAEPGSELATMSTRSKPSEPLFNEKLVSNLLRKAQRQPCSKGLSSMVA